MTSESKIPKVITAISLVLAILILPIATSMFIQYGDSVNWLKWVYFAILLLTNITIFVSSYLLSDFKGTLPFIVIFIYISLTSSLFLFFGFFSSRKRELMWHYIGILILYFVLSIDGNRFFSMFPSLTKTVTQIMNVPYKIKHGHIHTSQQMKKYL
jgi:hypothetical protein